MTVVYGVDVLRAIANGEYDAVLIDLLRAVQERIRWVDNMNAHRARKALSTGDTVRFNDRITPAYLVGHTATVVRVNSTTVTVRMGDDVRRYSGRSVRCPVGYLESVR